VIFVMGLSEIFANNHRRTHRRLFTVLMMLGFCFVHSQLCEARLARDQAGRAVTVPDNPVRIVSLAPSITEIIFALGEGERIKGVTQHCDFPAEARALPRVGSYVHPDLERIVALKPDLCLAIRDGNPRNVVDKLEGLGIPVYAVDPRNLDTVVETVLELGRILNATPKAESLAKDMSARIERVKARVARADRRPGVFFQIGLVPIVSAGANTLINELIAAGGGQNLANGSTPYPRFSREQVLALRPDVIIISSMTKEQDLDQVKNEWKQYDSLPAVQNGHIYVVDANLLHRPTPRLIEGLETLAAIIHPELF
jgi:iron complex transport system substrate-binding protein